MRILLPKMRCEIERNYGPFFFLAGPVRGGNNWQVDACAEIGKHVARFYAAVPCREHQVLSLSQYRVAGTGLDFDRQLTWERYYLRQAGQEGCVIFWLPRESKIDPRGGDEPYAMNTRGELGEWRAHLMYNPNMRVVVGAEPGFYGLSEIKRNFNLALGHDFPVHDTLSDTVAAAMKEIKRS